jgi:HK97 family phage major capsid protein
VDTYLETLVTQRKEAAARIKEIVAGAAESQRSITAEEQETLEKADADYDRLKAEEDKLVAIGEKLAAGDVVRSRITTEPQTQDDEYERKNDRQIMSAVQAAQTSIRHGAQFSERTLDFNIDYGKVLQLSSRAISDFANAASLYVNDFSTRVAVYQRTLSPLLRIATVIDADNGRPLVIPSLTVDPSVVSPGEGTAITENSGTEGSATATPVSYKALSYISAEAEEDELIGLLQLISQQQGRQLGFTAGTAMSAALLTAATNGGTANGLSGGSTATFIGYEDLLDLKYGRAYPYRQNGAWLASNGMIKKMRKYTDKNGRYLWQDAIAAGQPPAFDGDPVYEDPGLATPASATKSIVYGDFSAWIIKQRALRVAVSVDFKFDTDQVAVRTVYRAGGALADTIALAYLVSANT